MSISLEQATEVISNYVTHIKENRGANIPYTAQPIIEDHLSRMLVKVFEAPGSVTSPKRTFFDLFAAEGSVYHDWFVNAEILLKCKGMEFPKYQKYAGFLEKLAQDPIDWIIAGASTQAEYSERIRKRDRSSRLLRADLPYSPYRSLNSYLRS